MQNFIPKEFIQRLREVTVVSAVIGKRIPLKRKGREWEACCPFHQEKSPSFFVNDAKGFYHCFGCSAHGDSIKFLMEYERLGYIEAIEELAREAGMDIPRPTPDQREKINQQRSLEEVMEQATQFYTQQLSLSVGHEARDYLLRRGLSEATIKEFRLGYAPAGRNALKEYLLGKGIKENQQIEAGLLIKTDDGATYDRFRDRVTFPILDAGGQVIAFGGRLLQKDAKAAKYLNSPETPLFLKGHVLYNWRQARAAVDDKQPLIIVEGYMDVIALHQAGVAQAVAPLGTALTETHLQRIWQGCDHPVLCLDGDAAGQRAMWRSAELAIPMLQAGKSLRFLVLPSGQDPDDFLRTQGVTAFRRLLESAMPLSQVILQHLRQEIGDTTPEQRAALEAKLEETTRRIGNTTLQGHFRQFFRQQLWGSRKGTKQQGGYVPTTTPQVLKVAQLDSRQQGRITIEKQMLRLLLLHPELLQEAAVEEAFGQYDFLEAENRGIAIWLQEQMAEPALPPESLWPSIARSLRDNASIGLPPQTGNSPLQAWQQVQESISLSQMQEDIESLEIKQQTHGWTEETQKRINLLKKEIEELQAKRYV
jgi:DNA primase